MPLPRIPTPPPAAVDHHAAGVGLGVSRTAAQGQANTALEGPRLTVGGSGGNGGEGERRGSGSQPQPRVPAHREFYQSLQRTSIHTPTTQQQQQQQHYHQHHHHAQHHHSQQYSSSHPQHQPQVISATTSSNPHPPLPTSTSSSSHLSQQRRLSRVSQHSTHHQSSEHYSKQKQQQQQQVYHPAHQHQNHIQKSLSSSGVDEKEYNTKVEVTTCCCFSSRFHREHGSLFATLLGSISLACLLASIVTDSWIHTEEFLQPPPPNFDNPNEKLGNLVRIEFTIGLWKVCPTILQEEKDVSNLPSTDLQKGKKGFSRLYFKYKCYNIMLKVLRYSISIIRDVPVEL